MLKRIIGFLHRSKSSINFIGFHYFIIACLARLSVALKLRNVSNYLFKKYNNRIQKYLHENYSRCLLASSNYGANPIDLQGNIWVLWWQGEDEAPSIIKSCIDSIRKNSNFHNVVVLNKFNFRDYANLPTFILDKFNKGKISIQQLSDIIRLYLLSHYGGMWLDASIYLIKPLDSSIFKSKIYTAQTNGSKWCGFYLGGSKHTPLFSLAYNMICAYWRKEDSLLDYFLIDHIIQYIYNHHDDTKKLIDGLPSLNNDILFFSYNANKPFNETKYNSLMSKNTAFKLTWKKQLNKNHNSFGGYLLNSMH